jgi:hypothetical protein
MKKLHSTTKLETKSVSIFIENLDGVHTHVRNGEKFKGKQIDCPLCINGSDFERSFGKIGA